MYVTVVSVLFFSRLSFRLEKAKKCHLLVKSLMQTGVGVAAAVCWVSECVYAFKYMYNTAKPNHFSPGVGGASSSAGRADQLA